MQRDLGKLLREPEGAERRPPLELLRIISDLKRSAQTEQRRQTTATDTIAISADASSESPSVGQFQVSEMIGDR